MKGLLSTLVSIISSIGIVNEGDDEKGDDNDTVGDYGDNGNNEDIGVIDDRDDYAHCA